MKQSEINHYKENKKGKSQERDITTAFIIGLLAITFTLLIIGSL